MGKGTFIAVIALLIATAGAIVAFAAYFKHRSCTLCEDFDDEMPDDDATDLNYYATQMVDEDGEDSVSDIERQMQDEESSSAIAEDENLPQ